MGKTASESVCLCVFAYSKCLLMPACVFVSVTEETHWDRIVFVTRACETHFNMNCLMNIKMQRSDTAVSAFLVLVLPSGH